MDKKNFWLDELSNTIILALFLSTFKYLSEHFFDISGVFQTSSGILLNKNVDATNTTLDAESGTLTKLTLKIKLLTQYGPVQSDQNLFSYWNKSCIER